MRSSSPLVIILLALLVAGCGDKEPKQSPPATDTVARRTPPLPYDTNCVPPPPTRMNLYVGWPEYDTVTADLIRCLPDTTLDRAIYLRTSRELVGTLKRDTSSEVNIDQYMAFMRLPPALRMVWSTWGIEMETSHGGFDQYFVNTSASFSAETITALKMIGATRAAALAESAYDLWVAEQKRLEPGSGSELDGAARKRYFDAIDSLSTQFNEIAAREDRTENVAWLRVQYIRGHPDEFISSRQPGAIVDG